MWCRNEVFFYDLWLCKGIDCITGIRGSASALGSEGATIIYKEKFTGTKTDRPQLNELLSKLKEGDKLVVTKLDRLAHVTLKKASGSLNSYLQKA